VPQRGDPPSAHAGLPPDICGQTIGPWEYVKLDGPLNCPTENNPALTVIGPAVLDLNGKEVHCDNELNNGIEIIGWYATVKNGLISDCLEGVVVGGFGYHRVRGLEIVRGGASGDTGIVVNSNRNRIEDNFVYENDGTGILVNGSNNTLKRNRSNSNLLSGFQVSGNRNYLYDNTTDGNTGHGFLVFDSDNNRLIKNTATGDLNGFRIVGNDNLLWYNSANASSFHGFRTIGNDNFFWSNSSNGNDDGFNTFGDFNVFLFNSAIENSNIGFLNDSEATDNTYKYNTALDNGTDLVDETTNCDNNVWEFNKFVTSLSDACIN
jgi:parallel beta-helix repeat protein